jgi:adenosylhomocysteinase
MSGVPGVTLEPFVGDNDIFTTTTGSFQTMFLGHMKKLKNNAIVGNIGYCDDEIKVV